jgi:hypothetical protein
MTNGQIAQRQSKKNNVFRLRVRTKRIYLILDANFATRAPTVNLPAGDAASSKRQLLSGVPGRYALAFLATSLLNYKWRVRGSKDLLG